MLLSYVFKMAAVVNCMAVLYLTQYLKKKKKKSVCYWVFPSKHNSDRQAGVPQGGCDCPSLVGLEQAGGRLETVTLIPSTHPTNILFKT